MDQPFDTDDAIAIAIEKYADMVRRICFLYIKDYAGVEDVFQEVFLKYIQNIASFKDEQHQKSWLCRVTFNKCKDLVKSSWYRKTVSLNELDIPYDSQEQGQLIEAVIQLPAKYKELIYLHYYEGRTVPDIAAILGKNPNTIYTQLRRAKAKLKHKLEDADYGDL